MNQNSILRYRNKHIENETMKRLLNNFFSISIFILVLTGSAQAQFDFGAGLQYYGEAETAGIQARAHVGLGDQIALNGGAAYVFKSGNSVIIDADLHYKLLVINETTSLAPLAGLNFNLGDEADLGLNLGAELLIPIQDRKLYIEGKYVLFGVEGFVLSAGVLF